MNEQSTGSIPAELLPGEGPITLVEVDSLIRLCNGKLRHKSSNNVHTKRFRELLFVVRAAIEVNAEWQKPYPDDLEDDHVGEALEALHEALQGKGTRADGEGE